MAKYYSSTLQMGAKGDETKRWQEFLNTQGYNLTVDGDFGVKTDAATKDYQQKNGIGVDGIVGEKTWGKAGYKLSPSMTNFEYQDFSYDDYAESDTVTQAKSALDAQLSQKPGEYKSQWQTQLDDTINKILNREKFSYDLNGDALYQQYKDKFTQQGKMAMQDTMGQAAAMTGGYGNSYAQSVGQQAYNAQLENLNDIVPELYQMAYDRYNQEGQDLYNQYSMLGAQEQQDYGRHRDSVGDWQTERDYLTGRYDAERTYDYNKYSTERDFAYGQYADDKNYAYNDHRNAIADEQWQKNFEEAQRQWQMDFDEARRQFEETQKKSNVTGGGGGNNGNNNGNDKVDSPAPVETKDSYSDWDALDWESYFAQIRNSDGKSAAEEELNRMTKAGLIPKNMTSYAAIGARGKLGH
jgi:peptidoglycan hydrolase-like protein with peptidoglycan-binding domain